MWGTVKEKKSVHSAGRRASLGQGLLTPGPRAGRRWLAAVLSWGDEAGSGLPGPSGQKAPQRPALPPSPCETQRPRNPGPGPHGGSGLCVTSAPVRSESEGHSIRNWLPNDRLPGPAVPPEPGHQSQSGHGGQASASATRYHIHQMLPRPMSQAKRQLTLKLFPPVRGPRLLLTKRYP